MVFKPVSAFDIVVLTFVTMIIFSGQLSLAKDSSSIPFSYHIFNVSEINFVAKINSATDFLLQHSFPNVVENLLLSSSIKTFARIFFLFMTPVMT